VDPVGEKPAPPSRPTPDAGPEATGGEGTILLVEDNTSIRALFARVLARQGYRVLEAGSGGEGLDRAAAHGEGIDLLVTDIRMPGIQGPELARRLRAQRPDLGIVFITGFAGELGPDGGDLAGVVVLEKPFDIGTFTRVVAAALRAR
jgi:two-component system cell cycle sensor histidine kinase/response regulator CckA